MKTDPKYPWINTLDGLPQTIIKAMELWGVTEVVGKGSNKTIIGWRDELNQAGAKVSGFSDDDIAWCGLFAAIVAFRRKGLASEVVKDPLWARNWSSYGKQATTPELGDILVFSRGKGGHVALYIAEDANAYHVLGGNQGNKVSIVRVAKNRLLAVRRPPYIIKPAAVKPYKVVASGKLSHNEA
jgi:uncharacterized protein (TIGR02594 family)